MTSSVSFSVYLLSLFHTSSWNLLRLCPWTSGFFGCVGFFLFFFFFSHFMLFPGELATCIAFTVTAIQMTCKSVFPPMLLLLPSNPVSQAGSLTWCLLIILSFQNRTLSTSLLFYHKWQEHYPSCHSDSVTQVYILLLFFSCFIPPDQNQLLHLLFFNTVQICFFTLMLLLHFLLRPSCLCPNFGDFVHLFSFC